MWEIITETWILIWTDFSVYLMRIFQIRQSFYEQSFHFSNYNLLYVWEEDFGALIWTYRMFIFYIPICEPYEVTDFFFLQYEWSMWNFFFFNYKDASICYTRKLQHLLIGQDGPLDFENNSKISLFSVTYKQCYRYSTNVLFSVHFCLKSTLVH